MKNSHLTWYIVLVIILSSCANSKGRTEKNNSNTKTEVRGGKDVIIPVENGIKTDSINYDYKYIFSNDSISEMLYIKKGAINRKYNIPAKVEFKLILNDKIGRYSDREFEGVALLMSADESFSEKDSANGGDYFAADYAFRFKDCNLKIRLDIERYAACVVSTTCIYMKFFFKNYPDYDIMKRVN